MRVVGGRWRGHPLEAPTGRDTRPSTDRNREAIASMILSAEGLSLEGLSVLDAFAGSGAVGLELLSRGAASCTFVEASRAAASCVRSNLASVACERGAWHLVRGDARKALARPGMAGGPFDIVFLDPPYALPAGELSGMLARAQDAGNVAPGALVVYERASDAPGLELPGGTPLRSRRHGITSIDLTRLGGAHG